MPRAVLPRIALSPNCYLEPGFLQGIPETTQAAPLPQVNLKLSNKATGLTHLSRSFASILRPMLPCDNIIRGGRFRIEAKGIELSIQSRTADPQSPRHFGHLPTIMCNREPDSIDFHLLEGTNCAPRVKQGNHVGLREWRGGDERRRLHSSGFRRWQFGKSRRGKNGWSVEFDPLLGVFRRDLRGIARAAEGCCDLRKLVGADLVVFCQYHRPEYSVFQLAHIAGPAIGCQQRQRLATDSCDPFAFFRGETDQEMAGQFDNVFGPVRQ